MFLGVNKLLELVNNPEILLIENLPNRELYNPEGTGLDLRVGKLSRLVRGNGFLGVDERQTPETEVVAEVIGDRGPIIELPPHQYYLATTIERVNMPSNLVGLLCSRGTLFRSGVIILVGQINPGYSGILSFGIINASDSLFMLEMGARIVHLLVAQIEGTSVLYRGQWQDGRISGGREIQI